MKCYPFSPSFGWKVISRDKTPYQVIRSEHQKWTGCSLLWTLSSSPSDGPKQWVWTCPLGMEVASYPRVTWRFITESIVRYIDFQNLHLFVCTFSLFLSPKVGQKWEHGSSARKIWPSYRAVPILSWDGVRNTISMSTDRVIPISAKCTLVSWKRMS